MTKQEDDEALVQQIAETIEDALSEEHGTFIDAATPGGLAYLVAPAVLPLVEAQVASLRDEVERWKSAWAAGDRGWAEDQARAVAAESALRQVREAQGTFAHCPDHEVIEVNCDNCWAWAGQEEALQRVADVLDRARVGAADTQPEGPCCMCGHKRRPEHYTDSITDVVMCAVCECREFTPTAGGKVDTAPVVHEHEWWDPEHDRPADAYTPTECVRCRRCKQGYTMHTFMNETCPADTAPESGEGDGQ